MGNPAWPPLGRKPPGSQPTPHDSMFRRIFGVPANAASQLRAVLPLDLAARLDLAQLTPVPASFVDEALKWRYSDLLFTAPLDGRDAFVYLLAEHQSSTDQLMAFRMLRYVTRIWDQYLRDHPRARQLPAVIPLVVHHGRGRWAGPVQLLELIDLDPGAKQAAQAYLPRFEFLLDDLAASLGPDAEEAYVTTAQMLRAEGRAEGEARGRAEALVEILAVKFGLLPDSVSKTVHAASIDQVKVWTARAVTAETLDRVFR
jgi:predicted transposase YdaD